MISEEMFEHVVWFLFLCWAIIVSTGIIILLTKSFKEIDSIATAIINMRAFLESFKTLEEKFTIWFMFPIFLISCASVILLILYFITNTISHLF